MMETRTVSVGVAPHHQHMHHQQPHSILKKPPLPSATALSSAQTADTVAGGGSTRAAQPPPAEFADVAAQCYHPGGSIIGIGTSATLPRAPPPPKCPRIEHHHHHHGNGHHHQQQHLHGTIRRHAAASSALPACTCSSVTATAGTGAMPPTPQLHHTSSTSLAMDAATKTATAEELHVWQSNRGHRRSSDTEIDRLANDLTRICNQLRESSGGGGDLFYLWHSLMCVPCNLFKIIIITSIVIIIISPLLYINNKVYYNIYYFPCYVPSDYYNII